METDVIFLRSSLSHPSLWLLPLLFLVRAASAGDEPAAVLDPNASDPPPLAAGAPLSLDEAVRLSLVDQPVLTGREAQIGAEEQQAIALRQLPDPKLSGGLKELPIDTGEAFSVRRDSFTEFTVGLSQDFPRADKRRLKGERKQLEAEVDRAALDNDERAVRRDTSLSWLDVYESEQGLKLTQRLADEASLQVRSLEKDYGNGKASQADWFAARVDAGLVEDRAHDWLHRSLRMRAGLARWIGDSAQRPLSESPALPAVPNVLPDLIARVDHHPVIGGLDKQIEAATTDVALARQAYKPDFSVEGYFAYRQDFADFVGVQVSIDLPYFTKNRQDRGLAAALEQSNASEARKRDLLRQMHAQVNQDYLDHQHFDQRVADFDSSIIPDAQRRVEAARSAYEAGRGSFDAVLLARRSQLDAQLQRLALAVESARAQIRLNYLTAAKTTSGEAP